MQVKLWKDYKILFLIIFGFVCFFININTANALVSKGSFYVAYSSGETHIGSINQDNVKVDLHTYFPSTIDATGYDILAIPFSRFNITVDNSFSIDNPYLGSDYGTHYLNCTLWDSSGNCSKYSFASNITSYPTYLNGDIGQGQYTVLFELHSEDEVHVNACYLSDDYKGFILCPTLGMTNAKYLKIRISQYGFSDFDYNIDMLRVLQKFNYESSEIVSALANVSIQQQQTSTIIQQQTTVIQDTNISGTEQQVSTDFSSTSSELSTASNSVNDLTNIIMAPLTLFMDLSSSSCTPIHLVVPFVNTAFDLPCMSTIYNAYFSTFLTIFATVISSITCYWISIKTIKLIKELLDCDNDRIEVLDL